MNKRIAFCADGTWDSAGTKTNVYKLFKALPVTAGQMPFYDDGVGVDGNPLQKLLGGAFGAGLFQKIKDGYTKIAQVYVPGDDLFIFGFSRGAYTARSLAGMIAVCGLPSGTFDDNLVETAFKAYRNRDQRASLLANLSRYEMSNSTIKMVGVWDTVGSLGIPALAGGVDPNLFGFLDTGLHPDVQNAYHALAIDERRAEFPPTLWTSQAPGQTVEQVWFCGVHSDVGGGYENDPGESTALSDITLGWMIDKASALGLAFDASILATYAVPLNAKFALDQLHDSWNVFWGFPKKRSIANTAALADSVLLRSQHDVSWRPENLIFMQNALAPQYKLVPVVGARPSSAQMVS